MFVDVWQRATFFQVCVAGIQSKAPHVLTDWQIGDSLEEFLIEATSDAKLRQVLMSLSEATRTIAFKVGNLNNACSCRT